MMPPTAKPKATHLDIWVIMISHPETGKWCRVGKVYRSKEVAKSWVKFASRAWGGAIARVRHLKIELGADGKATTYWAKRLLKEYDIEVT